MVAVERSVILQREHASLTSSSLKSFIGGISLKITKIAISFEESKNFPTFESLKS